MHLHNCQFLCFSCLQAQPKVQDYEKVRTAISDLMSSEKAEDYDDGENPPPSIYCGMGSNIRSNVQAAFSSCQVLMPGLFSQAPLAPSSFAWHGTAQEAMTKVCILYAATASRSCLLPWVLSAWNVVLGRTPSLSMRPVCDKCVLLCSIQHRRQQWCYNEVGNNELTCTCNLKSLNSVN